MIVSKYYLYEGTEDTREETDRFDSKSEAIKRAKVIITDRQLGRLFGQDHYTVYVIRSSTGEFVHTETTRN